MKRLFILLAVVPALALTACGGSSSNNGVATAGHGKPGATSKASADPQRSQVKYAQCLRAHGVNMPDDMKNIPASGISISDQAQAACGRFQPQGTPINPNDPATHDRFVALARCMRGHGFNWPDPAPGTLGGPPPNYNGGSNPAKWKQSMADCQKGRK